MAPGEPMETFFRKYFWTMNLLFILLVAWLVARTVNLFVESAIAPPPAGGAVTRVAQKARPSTPRAQLELERLARLTGIRLPEPESVVREPGPAVPAVDPNAAPVKSGLRVRLLGTLVASNPQWSFAALQDAATSKVETLMVGDSVQSAEILEIERERVIIRNGGRREFIDGQAGDGAGAPPVATHTPVQPPAVATNTAAPAGQGSGIRATGDNEYEVPRPEIDRTLGDLNSVAMQARIVPAFKDGQAQGFKLFSIRPDSIYTRIGVQNGDVIRRINGFDLNSPEKALEVYTKLREANRIEIELERNGQQIRKTYNIR